MIHLLGLFANLYISVFLCELEVAKFVIPRQFNQDHSLSQEVYFIGTVLKYGTCLIIGLNVLYVSWVLYINIKFIAEYHIKKLFNLLLKKVNDYKLKNHSSINFPLCEISRFLFCIVKFFYHTKLIFYTKVESCNKYSLTNIINCNNITITAPSTFCTSSSQCLFINYYFSCLY